MEEVKMDMNAAILETTELSERYYFSADPILADLDISHIFAFSTSDCSLFSMLLH